MFISHLPPATRTASLFTVLAMTLAACGGTMQSESGTAVPAPVEPPASAGPEQPDAPGAVVVYSGRNENLVADVFAGFTAATGIEVEVRYGDTAELAIQILEEGERSPADVYFGQDAGALGALQAAGQFAPLPEDLLELVDPRYRSREGEWIGVTGRSRNLVVNTDRLDVADVPSSVLDLVDPRWKGQVGWAPTNGSFQSFVTAMRLLEGEEATRAWLDGMIANDVVQYANNTAIVEAVGRGEITIGLTNNYYLPRFIAEDASFPAVNVYLPGDVGGIVNVAGVGVLASSSRPTAAVELVRYLLSLEVQTAFGARVDAAEFPLRLGVGSELLPTLDSLDAPDLDLSLLEDLQGTLALLNEVRAFD
jgi:iron(III) transport system substrate-binding protein